MSWCVNFSNISLLQTGSPVWNLEELMYRVIFCTFVGHCPENITHFAMNRAKPFTLYCIKGKVTFLFCSWERTQSPRFFSFLDLTRCNKLDFFNAKVILIPNSEGHVFRPQTRVYQSQTLLFLLARYIPDSIEVRYGCVVQGLPCDITETNFFCT